MTNAQLRVGVMMFAGMTQLDMTGPLEVLSAVPGWTVDLVAPTMSPVLCGKGFAFTPTVDFENAPQYDLLVVPGGPGVDDAMLDRTIVSFAQTQSSHSRYVFGICTGSLLLAAAGCLTGRRASCHWQAVEFLPYFGVIPSRDRMTIDGRFFTSGGVTAGIDMALKVVGELAGVDVAQGIQLLIEYDPEPPFQAGVPETAPAAVVERLTASTAARRERRLLAVLSASKAAGFA
ncbi:DJ-1/PfpI family protein [Pandoraea oxalativorans]|uniref:Dimethylglycine dehydrogenase n=1 Tax=Pandoraea oxalativorans TaxID=573737 RepID=A0A0E3YCJ7_9BURK|nr:DJ-1/PfpI family protein [Pandoraea oxalativorans]AKC70756.1 dimethylglycine dehydrogenase [Pandoraea oxalativorans]